MSKEVQVRAGVTPEAFGSRFVDAWHRAERGELTAENAEIHVSFETWEMMVRTLSPKRLELLRHVHQKPARSIRALASSLGRDYRRVHDDVEALEGAGLLERDKEGVRAEYHAFKIEMRLAL